MYRLQDRIFNRLGTGLAMTDDAGPIYSQKGCATILGIVNTLFKGPEGRTGQEISQFCHGRFNYLISEHLHCSFRQSFTDLQTDIADKAIANNNVNIPLKDITSFNISDKMQRALLQQLIGLLDKRIALPGLLSYG